MATDETSPLARSLPFNAPTLVLWITVLVAFLPYVPAGYRAEHVLAPVFAVSALCFLADRSLGAYRWLAIPLSALTLGAVSSIISSLISSGTGSEASVVNMFIRLAMPPVLLFCFVYLIEKYDIAFDRIVTAIFCSAIIVGALSLLSISSFFAEFFSPFVAEDGIWRGSRGTGRYPGIFNQPIEAGLYFGLTTLCLAYVYKALRLHPLVLIVGFLAILLGGSVSLSKTFFLGIGVVTLYLIALRQWRMIATVAVGSVAVIAAAYYVLDPSGAYLESLLTLLRQDGPIAALTAGRFGVREAGGTEMATRLMDAASESWPNLMFGFGLGSFMPLDSGFFEYAYQAGLVGLFGYLGFFVYFVSLSLRYFRQDFGKLLFFVCLFVVLASFGGPTLTANRAGYLVVLLFAGALVEGRRRASRAIELSASST